MGFPIPVCVADGFTGGFVYKNILAIIGKRDYRGNMKFNGKGLIYFKTAFVGLFLCACGVVTPESENQSEQVTRIVEDRAQLKQLAFANNRRLMFEPVTLEEAIARATRYNLNERVAAFEAALAQKGLTVAELGMLPDLTAKAGYSRRSSRDATFSEDKDRPGTPDKTRAAGSASNQGIRTSSLEFSWNILDFGVSYLAARQASNQYLIAKENQRRSLHNLLRDVQSAFWRTVASKYVLSRWGLVKGATDNSLNDIRELRAAGVSNLRRNYEAERGLLDLSRRLEDLQTTLVSAKIELASLIGAPPGTDFEVEAGEMEYSFPDQPFVLENINKLETVALAYRPEVREQVYRERIGEDGVRRAILEMIPGLRFSASGNYTSDTFKRNSTWFSYGPSVSYNLFSIFQGPARMEEAEMSVEIAKARRLAVGMAVLAQVHISTADYFWSLGRFDSARQLMDVNSSIAEQVAAEGGAGLVSNIDRVRSALDYMISVYDYYNSYATLANSYTRVLSSSGIDYLDLDVVNDDLPYNSLLKKVQSRLAFDKKLYIERSLGDKRSLFAEVNSETSRTKKAFSSSSQ